MKTRKYRYFIGIDIASKTFYASLFDVSRKKHLSVEFSNTIAGFDDFFYWFKEQHIAINSVLTCMEATGVYCESLCYYLSSKKFQIVVEAPHKVKRTFHKLTKNDKVDSEQIAEYAYRFHDDLSLWNPKSNIIEKIGTLLTTREGLVSQRIANGNSLKMIRRKVVQSRVALKALEMVNTALLKEIEQIEKEIKKLIKDNDDFHHLYLLVSSIPAVKLLFFANILVLTNGFSKESTPKQMASLLGIAPHEHTSGTSVRRKSRSTKHGPHRVRKLLYLATLTLRTHNVEMKTYFERKKLEGKPPKLILNNMANKLIKIIYAVVRERKQFIQGYISVPPIILQNHLTRS